jgi:hypothetical protein
LSTTGIEAVQAGYESFCQVIAASGAKLPINSGGDDLLPRKLDYAVINHGHASLKQGALQAFDTLCSAFIEGTVRTKIQVSTARLVHLAAAKPKRRFRSSCRTKDKGLTPTRCRTRRRQKRLNQAMAVEST